MRRTAKEGRRVDGHVRGERCGKSRGKSRGRSRGRRNFLGDRSPDTSRDRKSSGWSREERSRPTRHDFNVIERRVACRLKRAPCEESFTGRANRNSSSSTWKVTVSEKRLVPRISYACFSYTLLPGPRRKPRNFSAASCAVVSAVISTLDRWRKDALSRDLGAGGGGWCITVKGTRFDERSLTCDRRSTDFRFAAGECGAGRTISVGSTEQRRTPVV